MSVLGRGWIAVFAVAGVLGCGPAPTHQYDNNDLELLTAYTAKETCSCLFVMQQDEAFCRLWTRANPPLARVEVDTGERRVFASALFLWGASARFDEEAFGCVLD